MRFLTRKQVKDLTTLSFTEQTRREAVRRFPERQRLSEHPRGRVVYKDSDIQEWMEDPIGYYRKETTDNRST